MSYVVDFTGGIKRHATSTIFIQTATGSCANTTSETTITSTGIGSLILPANFFVPGRSLLINALGYHSSTGNPTITIKLKAGSTVLATITGSSGNGSSDSWALSGLVTCRTGGASGTIFSQLYYNEVQNSGLRSGNDATTTVTLDCTASQALTITAQWSAAAAGNNIHLTNAVFSAIA